MDKLQIFGKFRRMGDPHFQVKSERKTAHILTLEPLNFQFRASTLLTWYVTW